MCTSDCRIFVWGGAGEPAHGTDGQCSCICQDKSWSNRNILGRASCVPDAAHEAFGLVGLAISVGVLCHAAYHLRRQNKFHERALAGSCTPVELCRWHLHIHTVIAATLSILYFVLVLGDALRWCGAVGALATAPAYVGGSVLAARMWLYTNDPRLLRESPRVSGMSHWLEQRHGNTVACFLAAIVPIIAAVLAVANLTEMAARLVALGGVTLGVVTMVVFVIFGRVLVKAIDKSLQHQDQQQLQATRTAAGGVQGKNGGAGNHSLLDARRKVKTVVVVDVVLVSSGTLITLFAMIKGFDVEAPLVMFGITFANVPLTWLAFNIQVHSGRSRSHERVVSSVSSPPPRTSLRSKLFSSRKHQEQHVIPTEVPC